MAEGLTPAQLQQEMSTRISALVKDALVTVSMVGIVNNKAYTIGGGVPAGSFELLEAKDLAFAAASMDLTWADLRAPCPA